MVGSPKKPLTQTAVKDSRVSKGLRLAKDKKPDDTSSGRQDHNQRGLRRTQKLHACCELMLPPHFHPGPTPTPCFGQGQMESFHNVGPSSSIPTANTLGHIHSAPFPSQLDLELCTIIPCSGAGGSNIIPAISSSSCTASTHHPCSYPYIISGHSTDSAAFPSCLYQPTEDWQSTNPSFEAIPPHLHSAKSAPICGTGTAKNLDTYPTHYHPVFHPRTVHANPSDLALDFDCCSSLQTTTWPWNSQTRTTNPDLATELGQNRCEYDTWAAALLANGFSTQSEAPPQTCHAAISCVSPHVPVLCDMDIACYDACNAEECEDPDCTGSDAASPCCSGSATPVELATTTTTSTCVDPRKLSQKLLDTSCWGQYIPLDIAGKGYDAISLQNYIVPCDCDQPTERSDQGLPNGQLYDPSLAFPLDSLAVSAEIDTMKHPNWIPIPLSNTIPWGKSDSLPLDQTPVPTLDSSVLSHSLSRSSIEASNITPSPLSRRETMPSPHIRSNSSNYPPSSQLHMRAHTTPPKFADALSSPSIHSHPHQQRLLPDTPHPTILGNPLLHNGSLGTGMPESEIDISWEYLNMSGLTGDAMFGPGFVPQSMIPALPSNLPSNGNALMETASLDVKSSQMGAHDLAAVPIGPTYIKTEPSSVKQEFRTQIVEDDFILTAEGGLSGIRCPIIPFIPPKMQGPTPSADPTPHVCHCLVPSRDGTSTSACGLCFSTSQDLNKHAADNHVVPIRLPDSVETKKTAEKTYCFCPWPDCKRNTYDPFPARVKVARHLMVHTNYRPFVCTFCDRGHTTKEQLENHVRTHTKERPFECETCGHCSATATQHRNHLRTHTKERPFQCPFCPYKCSDSSNMSKHKRNKHGRMSHREEDTKAELTTTTTTTAASLADIKSIGKDMKTTDIQGAPGEGSLDSGV